MHESIHPGLERSLALTAEAARDHGQSIVHFDAYRSVDRMAHYGFDVERGVQDSEFAPESHICRVEDWPFVQKSLGTCLVRMRMS